MPASSRRRPRNKSESGTSSLACEPSSSGASLPRRGREALPSGTAPLPEPASQALISLRPGPSNSVVERSWRHWSESAKSISEGS